MIPRGQKCRLVTELKPKCAAARLFSALGTFWRQIHLETYWLIVAQGECKKKHICLELFKKIIIPN